jgi:hypothetical protein
MHDENDSNLSEALRALPMRSPPVDMWSQLATELQSAQRSRRKRWALPIAIAACAMLACGIFVMQTQQPATVADTAASIDTNAMKANTDMNVANAANGKSEQLIALQARSLQLEAWLHETAGAATPLPGHDVAAVEEIESLIGVVDVELTAPTQHDEEKLWRRRVNLLEDLTALRYSNYRLAEAGLSGNADHAATWIN